MEIPVTKGQLKIRGPLKMVARRCLEIVISLVTFEKTWSFNGLVDSFEKVEEKW